MATNMMSQETTISGRTEGPSSRPDRSVREIIASARSLPAPARGAWGLSLLSALLLWASFTPLDWGPLGWVAAAPLIVLVRPVRRTRWMYPAVFIAGWFQMVATLQWMRLGDPAMYVAWLLLATYLACYFPLFVWLARVAVHRVHVPLVVAAPVAWVGLEYARAHVMTGFAWYLLGHTQYRWTEIIQISDVFGAYGVSFVLVMSSACLAGLLPQSFFRRFKLLPGEGLTTGTSGGLRGNVGAVQWTLALLVFAAALGYGYVRRAQAEFVEGPRVALVQGNYTASLKHEPGRAVDIHRTHLTLTRAAIAHQPDVIVWPETMFMFPLRSNPKGLSDEQLLAMRPEIPERYHPQELHAWKSGEVKQVMADLAQITGAAMVLGVEAWVATPEGVKQYNSAQFVQPEMGLGPRYDKIHRVIFGEYVPLREEVPLIRKLAPVDFGISAGDTATTFAYGPWRFAPVICFEDTVPHLVRKIVKTANDSAEDGETVDCLVNLTNDGWFHGSSELDQHLITSAFRCVELRTPMVRAVNTGISAFIDGDGVILDPEKLIEPGELIEEPERQPYTSARDPKTGDWRKQFSATLIRNVPLDNRGSLYLAHGDWFAGSCGGLAAVLACVGLLGARGGRRRKAESA